MTDDPVTEAKRIVEAYLERSMARDAEGARQYLAPDCEIIFTGGRAMTGPEDPPAFNAKRYAWVQKRFLRTDAVQDPETGAVHVWNTGHLYGEWPDGTPFDGNRYVDFFAVKDGLIRRTEVWNDSAEILLARAGLAEAPL
ncbi:nuclear transport factor 2 family protein [Salipiger mucosus]|uniref:Putative inner membrane protein n=1 Tax=Salipiger mucosus DSM 16094 TaxID=1123237 RepID=S9Q9G9_9RHOB|nr:nuclear transport factor 2 family protein [Salipiger mucosus]EPX76597.1 Putative inner membrane protein [Salipiger mucosus DSM 16094]